MNIFVLDYDPVRAAQMQCDRHIVKMSLETAQLLCSVFPPGKAPYKRTHYRHPCALWARASRDNYRWLIEHGLALCREYAHRYRRRHRSEEVVLWCRRHGPKLSFPRSGRTHFALCCAGSSRVGNAVESYRAYYRNAKSSFAKWERGRKKPGWF